MPTYAVDTGGAAGYNSINAAAIAASIDQGAAAVSVTLDATTGAGDPTGANFTSMTNYASLNISPVPGQRHPGYWDSSKYRVTGAANSNYYDGISVPSNSTVDGVQIAISNGTYTPVTGIHVDTGYPGCVIKNNLVTAGTINATTGGITGISASSVTYIGNNIVYGLISGSSSAGINQDSTAGGLGYYNTVIGCDIGYKTGYQTITYINNIGQSCTGGCFSGVLNGSCDYNLSDDGSAPGTHSHLNSTLTFTNAASNIYSLASSDTDAIATGYDLSTDANFPITTDCIGTARPSTPSLGALQYVATGNITFSTNGVQTSSFSGSFSVSSSVGATASETTSATTTVVSGSSVSANNSQYTASVTAINAGAAGAVSFAEHGDEYTKAVASVSASSAASATSNTRTRGSPGELAGSSIAGSGQERTGSNVVVLAAASGARVAESAKQITISSVAMTASASAGANAKQATIGAGAVTVSSALGMSSTQLTRAANDVVTAAFIYGNPNRIMIPARSAQLKIPARSAVFKLKP